MKPRHAAALALAGWYLLAPKVYWDKHNRTWGFGPFNKVTSEPIFAAWGTPGAFDTAIKCEKARDSFVLSYEWPANSREAKAIVADPKAYDKILDAAGRYMQCMATDDPRLAK